MNKAILEEVSAGGVVYRAKRELSKQQSAKPQIDYEFLIGKHSGYKKWVLPKGLVESGESDVETAEREVAEEVGVVARVSAPTAVKTIRYYYYADIQASVGKSATGEASERRVKKYQESGGVKTRIHKKVRFYLMEYSRDLGGVGWEMSERKWVSYQEGLKMLAFESEREVFEEAGKILECSR